MKNQTQDKTIETPLAMIRVSMHSRTRSHRETIADRLLSTGLGILNIAHGQTQASRIGILYERNTGDAIRQGLAFVLKGKLKGFSSDGKTFRIISTNQKGLPAGDLGIILDLQEASTDTEYGKVGKLSYSPTNGGSVGFTPGEAFDKIPAEQQKILQDPGDLLRIGKESLFDSDLRQITDYLLTSGKFQRLFSGCFLAASQEQIDKAKAIREALSETLEGKYTLSVIGLANGVDDRQILGQEIEIEYVDRLEKMLSSLEDTTKGNVKRISGELEELESAVNQLEGSLGYEFSQSYWDAVNPVHTKINEYKAQFDAEELQKGPASVSKTALLSQVEELQKQLAELKAAQEKEAEEKKHAAKAKKK